MAIPPCNNSLNSDWYFTEEEFYNSEDEALLFPLIREESASDGFFSEEEFCIGQDEDFFSLVTGKQMVQCQEEKLVVDNDEDSEESLDGESFEWNGISESKDTVLSEDFFMPWILNLHHTQMGKKEMNCAQGAIYYISQYDGGQLAKEVGERYFALESSVGNSEGARYALYQEFSFFLGLDQAEGPFDLDKVDTVWESGVVQPGSVISFGNNSARLHVVVVTKSKKVRSLWESPVDDTQDPFGKYPYKLVFDQVQEFVKRLSSEEAKRQKVERVFFVSNRFCPLFD